VSVEWICLHGRYVQHGGLEQRLRVVGGACGLESLRQGGGGSRGHRWGWLVDVFHAGDAGVDDDTSGVVGDIPVRDDLLGVAQSEFTELFRSTYPPVRAYLLRMVGTTEAEDLTAEVFTTVWARWAHVPAEPTVRRAWVFGVAHNKVLELIRARQRGRGLLLRLAHHPRDASSPGSDESVVALQRTRDLLEMLSPSERDAVALTALAGLSSAEAATVLDCSVSAVTSRVSRARQRLQTVLTSEMEGGER
jgi:RNA polymerase sigma-70 factor (ECF subfamily)